MADLVLKPMSFGELVDTAVALYRRHFGAMLIVSLAGEGIPALVWLALDITDGVRIPGDTSLAAMAIGIVGGLIAQGALVRIVGDVALGESVSAGRALRRAVMLLPALLVAFLGGAVVILLASVFFLVPGLVVICGYCLFTQAIVLEPGRWRGFSPLARSWQLMDGFKWKAFGIFVLLAVFTWVPGTAAGFLTLAHPSLRAPLMAAAHVLQLLVFPVVVSSYTLLYYDVRVRTEGLDLDLLDSSLGPAAPAPAA